MVFNLELDSAQINGTVPLTERELEVIARIADGFQTKEIAELLFISPATVKAHRKNIIRKMKVPNASAAVSECLRFGLI
jgi:two-component system, NarL family, invasion response regulator UvrY